MGLKKKELEVLKLFKKIDEGLEVFDDLYEEMRTSENPTVIERAKAQLKTHLMKLQVCRSQIRTWIERKVFVDVSQLEENCKRIEAKMEFFRVVEKDLKLKAFSNEGLATEKVDLDQQAHDELTSWVAECISELRIQVDKHETEIEKIGGSSSRKKRADKTGPIAEEREKINSKEFHISKIEKILRALHNRTVLRQDVEAIKDDVQYYIECNEEPDFVEDEQIYDHLDLNNTPTLQPLKETWKLSKPCQEECSSAVHPEQREKSDEEDVSESVIQVAIAGSGSDSEKDDDSNKVKNGRNDPGVIVALSEVLNSDVKPLTASSKEEGTRSAHYVAETPEKSKSSESMTSFPSEVFLKEEVNSSEHQEAGNKTGSISPDQQTTNIIPKEGFEERVFRKVPLDLRNPKSLPSNDTKVMVFQDPKVPPGFKTRIGSCTKSISKSTSSPQLQNDRAQASPEGSRDPKSPPGFPVGESEREKRPAPGSGTSTGPRQKQIWRKSSLRKPRLLIMERERVGSEKTLGERRKAWNVPCDPSAEDSGRILDLENSPCWPSLSFSATNRSGAGKSFQQETTEGTEAEEQETYLHESGESSSVPLLDAQDKIGPDSSSKDHVLCPPKERSNTNAYGSESDKIHGPQNADTAALGDMGDKRNDVSSHGSNVCRNICTEENSEKQNDHASANTWVSPVRKCQDSRAGASEEKLPVVIGDREQEPNISVLRGSPVVASRNIGGSQNVTRRLFLSPDGTNIAAALSQAEQNEAAQEADSSNQIRAMHSCGLESRCNKPGELHQDSNNMKQQGKSIGEKSRSYQELLEEQREFFAQGAGGLDTSTFEFSVGLRREPPRAFSNERDHDEVRSSGLQEGLPLVRGEMDTIQAYDTFSTEGLLFDFFFRQGTRRHYLATKGLLRRGWRYHTVQKTWFLRSPGKPWREEVDHEVGCYTKLDYQKFQANEKFQDCFTQLIDFVFQYRHLGAMEF